MLILRHVLSGRSRCIAVAMSGSHLMSSSSFVDLATSADSGHEAGRSWHDPFAGLTASFLKCMSCGQEVG